MNRQMNHEHVVAGIAAALRAGALSADAVALEARKAAEADDFADVPAPESAMPAKAATVTSLTERRLAQLPPDRRPLPSVAHYDQLLRRRSPGRQGPTSQEEAR
ncbi:transposase [Actinomadura sp. CNU-125]|nr:transposase [Actinomadura sp. CNU-125]